METPCIELEIEPGVVTLVDSDICEKLRLRNKSWRIQRAKTGAMYVASRGSFSVYLHRLVTSAKPKQIVDHINRNTLDNRLANLRFVTARQNASNRKPHGTRELKGVWWTKASRWAAQITAHGKHYHLGVFDHKTRAAEAYDRAALYFFADHACLNFPEKRERYRAWQPTR